MIIKQRTLFVTLVSLMTTSTLHIAYAQQPVSDRVESSLIKHGIEQYQAGQFILASNTFQDYLNTFHLPTEHTDKEAANFDYRQAEYYLVLCNLKAEVYGAEKAAIRFIETTADPVYRQRVAFALAQYYFYTKQFDKAIPYYEVAGLKNLSNEEIADAKFELAYCYFYHNRLNESKNLFAAIKDMPSHKYFVAGNYYYGLIAYNDKDYKAALKAFATISQQEEYKEIVPYYEAEINYYLGNKDKVVQLADRYLKGNKELFYKKEMHLLRAQTYFENSNYKAALPDFEYYLNHSERVKKEVFYEIGYTYYKEEDWQKAVATFKELSVAKDSLGQTSMYLLGDCYLRLNDKNGARNAFGMCSEMNFIPQQQQDATFLYAKLSYELGNETVATRKLSEYVKKYPTGTQIAEAKTLLSTLLLKSSNYQEAYAVISTLDLTDTYMQTVYQQVAVGRALQLMQDGQLEEANIILDKSLQHAVKPEYTAVAYFWKAEIAYYLSDYKEAVVNAKEFLTLNVGKEDIIKKISKEANTQNAQMIIGYAQLDLKDYKDAGKAFAMAQQKSNASATDIVSDATLRAADAAFMQKDYAHANKLYTDAINEGVAEADYALFQKAIIAGINNDEQSKISYLNTIAKNDNSGFKDAALLELANTQLMQRQFAQAEQMLLQLVTTSKNENLKAIAMYKLAYAYQEQQKMGDAKQYYKVFIEQYPAANDRGAAMEALRLLYVNEGDFDGYLVYAQEQKLPALDELTTQQSYFGIAEQEYDDRQWSSAITKLTSFLNTYPNSNYKTAATYYRAESYAATQNDSAAIQDYNTVISLGWSEYAEDANLKAANLALQHKNYAAVVDYYENVLTSSVNEQYQQKALEGLMVANYELTKYATAEEYAAILLKEAGIATSVTGNCHLYLGKIAQQNQDFNKAIAEYNKVSTANLGVLTAEAKYLSAEVLMLQNRLADAAKAADRAARTSSQYQYWVAKDFILLAKIMMLEKDYFEASAILEELNRELKIEELKPEVATMLEEVNRLQKSNSKIQD